MTNAFCAAARKWAMLLAAAVVLLAARTAAQANVTGNCISGRMTFDPMRMYAIAPGQLPGSVANPALDVSRYDFTIVSHIAC
jgi:hypothetical protein